MFGIPDWTWPAIAAVAILGIWKIFSRNEVDLTNPETSGAGDGEYEESDDEAVADLEAIADADDLMCEVDEFDFDGQVADALVKKALELKNDLTPNNWVDIFDSIENNGWAKDVAEKMAGDALQVENKAVSL